jgi:hypothetical protein
MSTGNAIVCGVVRPTPAAAATSPSEARGSATRTSAATSRGTSMF